jgi:hypothetical protein
LYTFLLSPIHAACPVHVILLHSITLIMFGEAYKLWSYSLRDFLHCHVTSYVLAQICCSAPCSRKHSTCVLPFKAWDQVSHPYKTR